MNRYPNGIVLLQAGPHPTSQEIRVTAVLESMGDVRVINGGVIENKDILLEGNLYSCDVIVNLSGNSYISDVLVDKLLELPSIPTEAEYKEILKEEDTLKKVTEESLQNAKSRIQQMISTKSKKQNVLNAEQRLEDIKRELAVAEGDFESLKGLPSPVDAKQPKIKEEVKEAVKAEKQNEKKDDTKVQKKVEKKVVKG